MSRELSLFIGTFTTLLAIINPIEVLPVYLKCWKGKMLRHTARSRGRRAFMRCF
jgi:multiple antibiotic resistance protein